jgi:hypothetical protein
VGGKPQQIEIIVNLCVEKKMRERRKKEKGEKRKEENTIITFNIKRRNKVNSKGNRVV